MFFFRLKVAFFFIFTTFLLYSQTELELLVNNFLSNNNDLLIQSLIEEQSLTRLRYVNDMYAPQLSLSYSDARTTLDYNFIENPQRIVTGVNITKPFPGSTSIAVKVNYQIENILENRFDKITKYSEYSPSLSFDLTQGLKPYWLQGLVKDPAKTMLELSYTEHKILKDQMIKDNVNRIVDLYFQLRKVNRQITSIQKQIEYFDLSISSLQESYTRGIIQLIVLMEEENKRSALIVDLLSALETKTSISNSLKLVCGDFSLMESSSQQLPSYSFNVIEYDPENRRLDVARRKNEMDYILLQQNNAPLVVLSGNVGYSTTELDPRNYLTDLNDFGVLNWSFSLFFDISPFFSSKLKREMKIYELNMQKNSIEKKHYDSNKEKSDFFHNNMISLFESLLTTSQETVANRFAYYEATKELYNSGQKNYLDFLQAEVQLVISNTTVANYRDSIWFHKWMINQLFL